jgi:hypothetical protein
MGLPLPRVIPDVGPGGPLVTAMGGMNALANNMHLKDINKVKAQFAPMTTQAEAASKLAYANLMGPQFLAKLLGNDAAIANMGDPAARAALQKAVAAGMGQGTGLNFLNQMPQGNNQFSGIGQPSTNSLSGWIANKLKSAFGQGQQVQPQNPFSQNNNPGMPQQGMQQPGQFSHPSNNPLVGQRRPNGAVTQVGQQWYDKDNNPVYDDEETNQTPMQMELTSGQSPVRQPTYAENTGNYKGTVEEGKELGKIRAKTIDEMDQQYQQAIQSEVPLKHMNEIVTNPKFQNLRKFPWFQGLQLDAKAKIGTPEEQKLIGDFQTTALKAVAETVMGFKGRILDKEVSLANDMKINKNDTIGVMLGKLPSIETFQEMTKQRSRLASRLMQKQHMNRGEALEEADHMVNGSEIRRKVENELNPITDDDIETTAKENGMTREQVIKRLKSEGRYHG